MGNWDITPLFLVSMRGGSSTLKKNVGLSATKSGRWVQGEKGVRAEGNSVMIHLMTSRFSNEQEGSVSPGDWGGKIRWFSSGIRLVKRREVSVGRNTGGEKK